MLEEKFRYIVHFGIENLKSGGESEQLRFSANHSRNLRSNKTSGCYDSLPLRHLLMPYYMRTEQQKRMRMMEMLADSRPTGIGVFEGRDGTRLHGAKPCISAEVVENPVFVVHGANLPPYL
jgi:hypothetical protein